MESGNTAISLKSLGWKPLEERRLDNKLNILKKGTLGKIDIPTDRLKLNPRQTRRGGGGPVYAREHSKIEAHRNSFFPSTTRLYNNLPVELRLCRAIPRQGRYGQSPISPFLADLILKLCMLYF